MQGYNDNMVDQDLIKKAVNEQLKAAGINIQGDEDARQDTPVRFNIGGQDYQFASQQEAETAINNAFSTVAQNQAAMMAQLEEAQRKQSEGKPKAETNEPQFDNEHFVNLIQKNPIEAFNYIDEVRYGPNRIPEPVAQRLQQVELLESQLNAYKFLHAHPEFQNTDQNAQVLRTVATNLGVPLDYNGLEASYRVASAYGLINPGQAPQTQYQQAPQMQQYATNVQAPPSVNRTGTGGIPNNELEAHIDNLSTEQLLALINSGQ
jgi:hypothetical protein